MKTHLSYREINFLLEKVKDILRENYIQNYKFKDETGKVPRTLLIEADTLEDILEKLLVAKGKCEIKYKKMVAHSKAKEKKLH
tara:strand:+ start:266 stop:514 length:249 start_codon:yes stop_codon:yes gene_type:complete